MDGVETTLQRHSAEAAARGREADEGFKSATGVEPVLPKWPLGNESHTGRLLGS